MSIFIKMKHWQLFLITWGLPIAMTFFTIGNPQLVIMFFPYIMVVYGVGTFGWIWAMSVCLHEKLPAGVNINLSAFKIMFFFPIIYIVLILVWFSGSPGKEISSPYVILLICVHLLAIACIFLCIRFAAKTIKSIELGRMARLGDYFGEFVMIWFMVFGVWFIQPRVNKIAENE